ncbi:MAG TPA: Phenylacetic acid catabolic protein [Longimicrobiales bacterium]|nr:Phenylacetic acid catabolic protein [Longimicrobiales bacterium]
MAELEAMANGGAAADAAQRRNYADPDALPAGVRDDVRDLILSMADSKRLLGMRYAEWVLGAPEIEAGIACASMAQDEWGHARLLYALLKDFGEDVDALEHGREASAYRSMPALDEAPDTWACLLALNAVVDGALTTAFEALSESMYEPLRVRCAKLLDEEAFHAAHALAWTRRYATGSEKAKVALADAVAEAMPSSFAWFGPADDAEARLRDAGIVPGDRDAARGRLGDRLAPILELLGVGAPVLAKHDWGGWDPVRRRAGEGAPDGATIEKIRGDKNRDFLMD